MPSIKTPFIAKCIRTDYIQIKNKKEDLDKDVYMDLRPEELLESLGKHRNFTEMT